MTNVPEQGLSPCGAEHPLHANPQHKTSNTSVFQTPHHTAMPGLPPLSVGSVKKTKQKDVVKITLLIA